VGFIKGYYVSDAAKVDFPDGDEHYEVIFSRVTIVKRGEAIFHETATHLSLQDLAGGEFVEIRQQQDRSDGEQVVAIEPSTWPLIRQTVDAMLQRARS
jgi:hypothetical protein